MEKQECLEATVCREIGARTGGEILIDGKTVGEVPLVFGPAEDCRARASGLSARLRELLRAARDARRR